MKFGKTILSTLLCFSMLLTSVGTVFAEEAVPATDENGTYLIDTAEKLFAFAEIAKATAEADTQNGGKVKTSVNAKLTADINLNPGVTFAYDHETGLVTVEKGGQSYKMGTGMKGTEVGSFHPVYNDRYTWTEWEAKPEESRNLLLEQMNQEVEALGLCKWIPIGTATLPYLGDFDGNGHTIDGLYLNNKEVTYTGFFGAKGNGVHATTVYTPGEIKNLTIGQNSLIVGHDAGLNGATGAFAGMTDYDTISNCTSYATVVGKGSFDSWRYATSIGYDGNLGHVGGIAGMVLGTVRNCANYGTVVSYESAGGIAGNVMGYQDNHGSIIACANYGKVYADTEAGGGRAGGIAVNAGGENGGNHFAGPIEACTNYGDVKGSMAGGILQAASKNTKIKYCANRGSVCASVCASGLVDYVGFYGFTMQGCYNAGTVTLLPSVGKEQAAYPLARAIHLYKGSAETHQIQDCYNDKTVCPAEDDALFGASFTTIKNCKSVPTEFFATGEPAYKMGSNRNGGWRQNIPTPEEEGKIPETYPTTDGERYVYEVIHNCCHTDNKNKEAHRTVFYSNVFGNITDEHTPDESGFCSHCGVNLNTPIFSPDTLPAAKVGKQYNQTINVSYSKGDIDDAGYAFPSGLTGKADYSWYKGYYYNISGIPTEAGTFTFTLSAENENGKTQKTYTLKINEADPLEITTSEKLDHATAGEGYWRRFGANSDFPIVWAVAEGSALPDGLTLGEDGSIDGTPTTDGTFTFTITASAGGQTTQKTFTLVVLEEGGCKHRDKTPIKGTPATCLKDGTLDYYRCNICGKDVDEDGNEIWEFIASSNHSDQDNNGKCDFCGKNMPVFKKVTSSDGIVYGGTYILAAEIDGKHYALALPPKSEDGKSETGREYTDLVRLCEVTPDAKGDFAFQTLEASEAMMIKPEFTAESSGLDAGKPRYTLSFIMNHRRYALREDGPKFYIGNYEYDKYGYRIELNDSGEALIGSVYQQWWGTQETAENGLLRAFDMTYQEENTKFMSFSVASYYNGEKGAYSGAEIREYPIYLYRMTDVGTTGGITFISNDSKGAVGSSDGVMEILEQINENAADAALSNVNGLANAVSASAVASAIEAIENPPKEVSVQICADIQAKTAETEIDEKGNQTPISVTYSISPKIVISDENGAILAEKPISNSDLNGTPITVTLYAGFEPEQVVHEKKDGTKEYFYPEYSYVPNGAKTFVPDNAFVTLAVTGFSDFKILRTAEPEEGTKNSLSFDGKTITATVDESKVYTLILQGYENRRLTYLKTAEISLKAGENPLELPNGAELSKVQRVLLWDDLSTLHPACGPLEITLK